MSYNPPMDNDLLSLWLKAGRGLAPDEARELVQRLADEKADHDAYCREVEADADGNREAQYTRGYQDAHREIANRLRALLEASGDEDVSQTTLWSLHTDLECEAH